MIYRCLHSFLGARNGNVKLGDNYVESSSVGWTPISTEMHSQEGTHSKEGRICLFNVCGSERKCAKVSGHALRLEIYQQLPPINVLKSPSSKGLDWRAAYGFLSGLFPPARHLTGISASLIRQSPPPRLRLEDCALNASQRRTTKGATHPLP